MNSRDDALDVEERLERQQQVITVLQESEERYRTLLENSPDTITVMDTGGRLLYLNRPQPGQRLVDIIGTSVFDYLHPVQVEPFVAALATAVRTASPQALEVETRSGHWWQTRLVPLEHDGVVTAVMGIGLEVTERRRAEEALRRSEEMLRVAVEAARMGLWTVDVARQAVTLDAALALLLGMEAGRVPLSKCLAALHPDDGARARKALEQARVSGELRDLEVRLVRPDGEVRWVLCSGKRAEGESGESNRLLGSVVDVTERKDLEGQLAQAHKMEAVGQLTAGIAHNFNNLLTAIIPSIQLARRQVPELLGERLQDAEYAATRAAELVRQLMIFAQHRRAVPRQPVDVSTLLRRTVAICRATFDGSIALEMQEGARVPFTLGEAGQLEQVFLNICLNARDAFEGSDVVDRRIRLELDAAGDQAERSVRVRISDNGPGMPEQVRRRIFEPFFTTKGVGGGSGLGLATAYAIVSDHVGKLSCESEVGVGTTFSVLLPGIAESAASVAPPSVTVPGGTETILVIDDERLVRSAVRSILEPSGYSVLEAAEGVAGLDVFRREKDRIDLVLLDLSMPGLSGQVVLASLLAEHPAARVVLFTGYPPTSIAEGARAILQKPVQLEELLRVVREVCDA